MVQKVRIFKLASEFDVENDVMVAKVQNLGFAVRNYMSAIDVEDAQRVRRLLERERTENMVEEQIRPTVVRRRTKKVAKPKPVPTPSPKEADVPMEETASVSKETEPVVPEIAESVSPVDPSALPLEPQTDVQPEVVESQLPDIGPELFVEGAFQNGQAPVLDAGTSASKESAEGGTYLRPAAEAPIIRRRMLRPAPDSATGDKAPGKGPRRRQVESREITPARHAPGAPTSKFGSPRGRKRRMTPGKKGKKTEITVPKAIKRVIRVEGSISLQDLAKRMSVKSTELLMTLMGMGVASININSTLDIESAKIVAEEFDYEVEDVALVEDELLSQTRAEETDEERAQRQTRPPIITMMGHVDHGKTSLLDAIRSSDVVSGEAGGITQHIGSYRAKVGDSVITFIDTPGHAAFTAMRVRGAKVTDIVILVTAADDGVMPQTVEAIDHARAAGCPIIVAVNKCDLPGADPERTRRMLMEHNLLPEELGGDTIIVDVSAKTGDGLTKLLEMINLQAEMMELDANPTRPATGVVLEAYLDRGRGPVANLLTKDGILKTGDIIVAGSGFGKIRAMTDEHGKNITEAGPSTPVEALGMGSVPEAGETFDVVTDMKTAEKVGQSRADKSRSTAFTSARPSTLEDLYEQMQGTEQVDLNLIIKSDVKGTTEALRDSLTKLTGEKVKVSVIHASTGGIKESDVLLASTSGSIIIGFNVRPAGKARRLAEEQGVEVKIFSIIYEVIDAVKAAMLGLLSPTVSEETLGTVEVRDTFTIPKIGTIAGSYVTDGKVVRNARARLIRDSVQIWEGRLSSLRRFKEDVKEVQSGFECGICLDGYNDVKNGDVIELYTEKETAATLT